MNRVLQFIQKERLYILILIFVLTFNAIVLFQGSPKQKAEKPKALSGEAFSSRRSQMEEVLSKNKQLMLLFSLISVLISAIILLGVVIDLMIWPALLNKGLDIRTQITPKVPWNIWDICKVVILFLFFGYIILLSEASLSRVFNILKIDNFRMVINTSILDIIAIVFVIYFSIIQYRENLKALGVSFKNFLKNIFYGVVGYISLIPVLILILIITMIVINITKYVPPRQPVVELFLKEKAPSFLAYTSFFAAIFGPIVEELFFRGFVYSAFKKYIGIFWSMVITAAIFAALHTHIVGFVPIMALGLLLAYLYEKTGTLVSSITVHIMHNLSMVFLVFLVKQVGIM